MESQGEFKNKPYHNVNLHCTQPFEADRGTGLKVEAFKVRVKILAEAFEKPITIQEIMGMVGSQVTFYFDKYNNVILVRVHGTKKPAEKSTGFPAQ
jgi:hypothetical protein